MQIKILIFTDTGMDPRRKMLLSPKNDWLMNVLGDRLCCTKCLTHSNLVLSEVFFPMQQFEQFSVSENSSSQSISQSSKLYIGTLSKFLCALSTVYGRDRKHKPLSVEVNRSTHRAHVGYSTHIYSRAHTSAQVNFLIPTFCLYR